jgi:hypothetical protein
MLAGENALPVGGQVQRGPATTHTAW